MSNCLAPGPVQINAHQRTLLTYQSTEMFYTNQIFSPLNEQKYFLSGLVYWWIMLSRSCSQRGGDLLLQAGLFVISDLTFQITINIYPAKCLHTFTKTNNTTRPAGLEDYIINQILTFSYPTPCILHTVHTN